VHQRREKIDANLQYLWAKPASTHRQSSGTPEKIQELVQG